MVATPVQDRYTDRLRLSIIAAIRLGRADGPQRSATAGTLESSHRYTYRNRAMYPPCHCVMVSLVLAVAPLSSAVELSSVDRPNILWLTSEDHGPQMGCYGDAYASTPHIDGLAAGDGLRARLVERPRVRAGADGAHLWNVSDQSRQRAHAQHGSAAREDGDVSAALAPGRLLLHEQQQDRLQPRRTRKGLGRVVRPSALEEP